MDEVSRPLLAWWLGHFQHHSWLAGVVAKSSRKLALSVGCGDIREVWRERAGLEDWPPWANRFTHRRTTISLAQGGLEGFHTLNCCSGYQAHLPATMNVASRQLAQHWKPGECIYLEEILKKLPDQQTSTSKRCSCDYYEVGRLYL